MHIVLFVNVGRGEEEEEEEEERFEWRINMNFHLFSPYKFIQICSEVTSETLKQNNKGSNPMKWISFTNTI
uniref:Uncharacterized protein n=1 Tax=Schistosoma haematobium TaxID=6185 RepID=A0A095AHR5_SCHHA